MENNESYFEKKMRQEIIEEMRQIYGEDMYKKLVDQIGEDEMVRSYLDKDRSASKPKYTKWLKNGFLIMFMPLVLGIIFYLSKQSVIQGVYYGFIIDAVLAITYNLIFTYRHTAVIFCLAVFFISLLTGLVYIIVPSLKNEHGVTAFIISGISLVLFLASLFVTFSACPKCGSLSSKHHVEYGNRMPGYPNVEYHSEICNSCGHQWTRKW